ncbi:hypothetical protein BHM03_00032055 [Ensete ventricosum]|nr:hypothetical protein BHM03_00032055 [Ensete ventricosum]
MLTKSRPSPTQTQSRCRCSHFIVDKALTAPPPAQFRPTCHASFGQDHKFQDETNERTSSYTEPRLAILPRYDSFGGEENDRVYPGPSDEGRQITTVKPTKRRGQRGGDERQSCHEEPGQRSRSRVIIPLRLSLECLSCVDTLAHSDRTKPRCHRALGIKNGDKLYP